MNILFEPFQIGSIKLRNRFVRSATQDWLGNADGSISAREEELYESLAANETGLIITAHAYVAHPLGRASIRQNAIFDDRFIDGFHRLADVVHKHGARLVIQISHAGRQSSPDLTEGLLPAGPSPVTDSSTGITPRELSEEEIWHIIDAFAAAAGRAKTAGADGVQIHMAHGYLLAQFLSPYTNRRTDAWGGNLDNRIRIVREIITRCRAAVGPEFPVLAKLNSTDGFTGPGYLSLDDVIETAKRLEKWGFSAIEISGGMREAKDCMSRPGILKPEQEGYFAAAAKAVKAAVSIPVILVGGLRSLTVMQQLVASGVCDLISLSRPFIRQPDLVKKFRLGLEKVSCVSCNLCFNPEGLKCRYRENQS